MKNKLLTSAAALTLVVMAGKFFAVPLLAQVRAALVQNVDERGRIPYQSSLSGFFGFQCAPDHTSCAGTFGAVPVNKRLVITHFDASPLVGSPGSLLSIRLTSMAGFHQVYPEFTAGGLLNGVTLYYNSSRDVLYYLDAGDAPRVAFFASGAIDNFAINATLSGYLLDCTGGCAPIAH